MKFQYRPRGVCSQLMDIEVEDGRIVDVEIMGGCPGNLQGISRLVEQILTPDSRTNWMKKWQKCSERLTWPTPTYSA